MMQVRLNLLGRFAVRRCDGVAIDPSTRKAQALLAVLACRGGEPQRRSWLTGLLWSDRGDDQARHSLSQALSDLRRAFGEQAAVLAARRDTVALDTAAAEIDVLEFQRLAVGDAVEALRQASELYRGPLLDGFKLREPAFEEWLSLERAHLHEMAVTTLSTLAQQLAERGDLDAAAAGLGRALEVDPLAEELHRRLIRLHLDRGAYNAAVRRYRACAEVLKRHLDVSPEPSTTALYREALRFPAQDGVPHPRTSSPHVAAAAPISAGRGEGTPASADAGDARRRMAVAVLPFVNIGGDPEQEFFADGFAEDIITDLSRFCTLRVATPNATFRYRHQGADVRCIGRALGVDYVVLGSVRRLGSRMRFTAQLVDACSDYQVWAERFDRDEDHIFAVADELVRTIAGTLAGRMHAAGSELAKRKPPASLAAYECVLRANAAELLAGDPQAEDEMRRFYEKAVALDPGYGRAHAGLAIARLRTWFRDMSGSGDALEPALEVAKRAVDLDPNDSECQATLAWILLHCQSFDLADEYCRQALALNPISPDDLASAGALRSYQGHPEEGIAWFERAKQVDPFFDPTWYWQLLGAACFNARRYGDAAAAFNRSANKPAWVLAYLAACHAQAGRADEAGATVAEATHLCPDFSAALLAAKEPYRLAADREHLLDGLRKAGFAIETSVTALGGSIRARSPARPA